MGYEEHPPPASLARFVRARCSSDDDPVAPHRPVPPIRIPADATLELIVGVGVEDRPSEGERPVFAALYGPKTRAKVLRLGGRWEHVSLRLHPGAAGPLLGVEAGELTDAWAPLDDVLTRPGEREQIRRLAADADARARLDRLAALLERRAADARLDERAERIERARAEIEQTGGRTRIGALGERLGTSQRTLERGFGRRVGMSARAFAGLVRLNDALRLLDHGVGLADAAHRAGYGDQPHFTREATRLLGVSPAAYLRERRALSETYKTTGREHAMMTPSSRRLLESLSG